jgi:hypothetical protein
VAIKTIWYTGWDLKKRWSLSQDDLSHYLINGDLIAYQSITSEPYSKEDIKDFIQDYNEIPWAYDETSGPWWLRFHADDVLKFEKLHNIIVHHDKDKNESEIGTPEEIIKQKPDDFPFLMFL